MKYRNILLPLAVIFIASCAKPINTHPTYTKILTPDESDNIGGSFLESEDIRSMSSIMAVELLSLPEINFPEKSPVRIAIAPVQNSTAYIFDKDILSRKIRLELSKYAKGKVRFISQNKANQRMRYKIIHEQDEANWQPLLEQSAKTLINSNFVQSAKNPLRVGLLAPKNINLTDMNADSFMIMFRSELLKQGGGNLQFIRDTGKESAVDYWLTGEFFAEGIKNYELKQRLSSASVLINPYVAIASQSEITIEKRPNVAKSLAILLVDSKGEQIVFSDLHNLERKVNTGLGRANFMLTGEVKGLHKAAGGNRSDYILVTFQLVDFLNNEIIWEGSYETKKVTQRSAVYK